MMIDYLDPTQLAAEIEKAKENAKGWAVKTDLHSAHPYEETINRFLAEIAWEFIAAQAELALTSEMTRRDPGLGQPKLAKNSHLIECARILVAARKELEGT